VDASHDPSFAPEARDKSQDGGGCMPALKISLVILFLLALLFSVALGPISYQRHMRETMCVQQLHMLGLALYSYAEDNNGEYPDGASSTEVFQKLLDGGYVSDPQVFYLQMNIPGKIEASPNQKILKPENVCFDVTAGLTQQDSPQAPLIFLTGFRIKYAAGGTAAPLASPFPMLAASHDFLFFHWDSPDPEEFSGIGVFYVSHSAQWILAQGNAIPNFVPAGFDAHGKTFRQLTPDGVLR